MDFYIRVGNSFNPSTFDATAAQSFTLCAYEETPFSRNETREYLCDGEILGRYVVIHFSPDKEQFLSFCEVEVYSNLGKVGHKLV